MVASFLVRPVVFIIFFKEILNPHDHAFLNCFFSVSKNLGMTIERPPASKFDY